MTLRPSARRDRSVPAAVVEGSKDFGLHTGRHAPFVLHYIRLRSYESTKVGNPLLQVSHRKLHSSLQA